MSGFSEEESAALEAEMSRDQQSLEDGFLFTKHDLLPTKLFCNAAIAAVKSFNKS